MTSRSAPPGWYRDPGGRHQHRYWDGAAWTIGVSDNGWVAEDPLPAPAEARTPVGVRPPEGRPALPPRALLYAGLGLVAAIVLAFVGDLIGYVLLRHHLAGRLILGQVGLWAGLLGACSLAARRLGDGRVTSTFGIRLTWVDIPRGLVASIVARLGAGIAVAVLYAIDRHLIASNTGLFRNNRHNHAALLTLSVIAVVGAPLVEEIFFRGLLLRALQSRLGTHLSVAIQALVFAAAHVNPVYGMGNISIVAEIALFGVVQGMLACHYRRLGPGIATHGFFNLAATLVILSN